MNPDDFASVWDCLLRYFQRRGFSFGVSEDLAGDTVLRVEQARNRGQTIKKAYYYSAAQSVVVDHVRRIHRSPESMEFEDVYPDHETEMAAMDILVSLTPQQRQVIELRAEGYWGKEVGVIVGRGKRSVWRTVRQAQAQLSA